jgi:hypothetical protein
VNPFWLKLSCSLFICLLVPVNWYQYGLVNFLWFSDLALFMAGMALWTDSHLLASMAALAVLFPEVAWNLDFFFRLTTGRKGIGLSAYMFDARISLWIRAVSLFHVWLPVLLVWLLYRDGYDSRALLWQTLLAAIVVPLSYLLGDSKVNVNWVYGFGEKPQTAMPSRLFALMMTVAFPVVIYVPTHFLLLKLVPHAWLSITAPSLTAR